MEKTVCLILLALSGSFAMQFTITDCNTNQKLLHVDRYTVQPYPPSVPGDITPSGHLVLGHNISGHLELSVKIHKKALLWLPIPCVADFGSCTYNFCDLLNRNFVHDGATTCPPQFAKQNLPCTCPFQAGSYTLNPDLWTIPELPAVLSWLSAGDYKVDATLTNKDTGEQVGCGYIEITLAHKCFALGCIFG